MPLFRVRVLNREGRVEEIEMDARDRGELEARLETLGFFPLKIRLVFKTLSISLRPVRKRRPVGRSEFIAFNQELVTLLKAGLPLVHAIRSLEERERGSAFSDVLKAVIRDVENGMAPSQAFERHPDCFPSLYVASLRAGEQTGSLVPSLKAYIEYEKRIEALRRKVVTALTYPVILAFASVCVMAFFLLYVVPSFTGVYRGLGSELPYSTRLLIGFTDFLRENILYISMAFSAVVLFLLGFLKTSRGRLLMDRMKLELPVISDIYRRLSASGLSLSLNLLLRSGMPLVSALYMARGVLNNRILESNLTEVIERVKEGEGFSTAVERTGIFSETSLKMLAVGESTGSLEDVLQEISHFHQEEVSHRLAILTGLIEPLLMVVMGVVVGVIVLLMYLPIFQMAGSI